MELGDALLLLLLLVLVGPAGAHAPPEPYDFLFDAAVEAYSRADWLSVILNMEKALRTEAAVRAGLAECRLRCARSSAFGEPVSGVGVPIPGSGSVHDLGFFQKVLKRAECVSSCETQKLGARAFHHVSEEVELEFRRRTPYNYLQVAYFKINKLDKAVAAAHTFSQANPQHLEMKQNLDYYRLMAGVQEEHFKDLEARPHMAHFLEGRSLYSDDSFPGAAQHFEEALLEYFTAEQECRALCEGVYRHDGYNYMDYHADLFQSITDHFLQVLKCKQLCSVELATPPGKDTPINDFLPSHFNYLQFSYYNSENLLKAMECAKTFLLFHPEDEVMIQNLNYYSVLLGDDKEASIAARPGVMEHIQQSLLEKELLYFGYEAFGIVFSDPDTWTPKHVMPKKLRDKERADRETAARITEEIGNLMKEIETLVEEKKKDSSDLVKIVQPQEGVSLLHPNIRVSMTSERLNGSHRVLLDGVLTDDQCRTLQRLSNAAAEKGDGYRGGASPHSPSELFQGVTMLKAAKLVQEGRVPLSSVSLLLELSDRVRTLLQASFQLDSALHSSFSHLVCRSAIDDKQDERSDLSHPVHVDNCVLLPELQQCVKEPPAYTHRDYSAILYLNDDFEGGEFFFTELDSSTVTAVVRPQCGRVLAFSSGAENPHGVRAVTQGQRCAVALWFTMDPQHQDKEKIQAEDLLKMFSIPLNVEFSRNQTVGPPEHQEGSPQASEQEETTRGAAKGGGAKGGPEETVAGGGAKGGRAKSGVKGGAKGGAKGGGVKGGGVKGGVKPKSKAQKASKEKKTVKVKSKGSVKVQNFQNNRDEL